MIIHKDAGGKKTKASLIMAFCVFYIHVNRVHVLPLDAYKKIPHYPALST